MQVLSKEAKRLAASREYVSKARELLHNQRNGTTGRQTDARSGDAGSAFTVTIDKETVTVRLVQPT